MESGEVPARLGVVGLEPAVLRGMISAAPSGMRVERCSDPMRFVTDATVDMSSDRALAVSLDVEDSWDLIAKLVEIEGGCPVLVLTPGRDEPAQLRAIGHGVAGVMSVEASPVRIIRAALSVIGGESILPSRLMTTLSVLVPAHEVTHLGITEEERRWLSWAAEGLTVKSLAERTGWSERQMRRRLTGLYLRMGAANRAQAVATAARLGLLTGT